MTKLTKRQNEILALIQSHMASTGSPPTRAEIAKIMGFRSPNAAEDHLRALARKGVIELVPGTSRGIRLAKSAGIPIIGKVSNKQNLVAEENLEGSSRLDKSFFNPGIDFFYHIKTSEFQNLGLLNGDFVAVHQTNKVNPGQLALVRTNQDLSIRQISEELMSSSLTIEGHIVGVIRSLTNQILA
jgi:repressor LexA